MTLAYIKSIRDFAISAVVQVSSWDLPIAGYGDTGSLTLLGAAAAGHEGDWLIMGERIYLISQTDYNRGVTTVTVQMPHKAFDRGLHYINAAASTERLIELTLANEYKTAADDYYAMPYLSISRQTETDLVTPELSNGLYKLSDYIEAVAASVACDMSCTDTALNVAIHARERKSHKIVLNTNLHQLKTRACSRDMASKVSVIEPESGANADYYLTETGTVSPTAPSARVAGRWISVTRSADEDAYAAAVKAFADNQTSHKIEFYGRELLGLYDTVTMRPGDTVESYQITGIRRAATDDRYLYTCGDLPVTLTDRVRQLSLRR